VKVKINQLNYELLWLAEEWGKTIHANCHAVQLVRWGHNARGNRASGSRHKSQKSHDQISQIKLHRRWDLNLHCRKEIWMILWTTLIVWPKKTQKEEQCVENKLVMYPSRNGSRQSKHTAMGREWKGVSLQISGRWYHRINSVRCRTWLHSCLIERVRHIRIALIFV
jgi:hypothetical protein